jgi:hypothetical protein
MSTPTSSALAEPDSAPSVSTRRLRLADDRQTTLHVAAFPLAAVAVRVVRLAEPETLLSWCTRSRVAHAVVGGFFVRGPNIPLGELRIGGQRAEHVPFDAPWGARRACVHIGAGGVQIAPRAQFATAPAGDLLQAGPLLVSGGAHALTGDDDEGFTSGAHQFDSDISDGRHPRSALALTATHLLAATCDGRHSDEAGLALSELATALLELGAVSALNLDGGGSTSLVCHGALVNTPREQHGIALVGGRPISTALVLSSVG